MRLLQIHCQYELLFTERMMINWHRVELHTHTIASDGIMEPQELVERSKSRGYDAIVVTDHNTTTSCAQAVNAGKKEDLLVIPGIEWTTFWGHIVVSGGTSAVDWRQLNLDNIDSKIKDAKKGGDLVTVAHPKRLGTPFCSECRFLYKINEWENIDAYEVWSHYNPHTSIESQKAKKEWSDLVNKGYKIAPVYGYDWHNPDDGGPAYAYTYVGVEGELTKDSLFKAIKHSHTYITMGVNLDVYFKVGTQMHIVGDVVKGDEATLYMEGTICEDYAKMFEVEIKGIRIFKDGKLFLAKKWEGKELEIPLELNCKNLRLEVYGKVDNEDADLAILAPLYIEK